MDRTFETIIPELLRRAGYSFSGPFIAVLVVLLLPFFPYRCGRSGTSYQQMDTSQVIRSSVTVTFAVPYVLQTRAPTARWR